MIQHVCLLFMYKKVCYESVPCFADWRWGKREGNCRTPKKMHRMHSEGVGRSLCRPQQAPYKAWKHGSNLERFSLIEKIVHRALSAHKQICDENRNKSNNHQGHTSGKSDTSLRRASGRSSGGILQGGIVVTGGDSSTLVTAPETFSWDRMWRWEALILMTRPSAGPGQCVCVSLKVSKAKEKKKKKTFGKKSF